MNAQRRKQIEKIREQPSNLRADLEAGRDEEQSALDNLPKNLQAGTAADTLQEKLDCMEDALQTFEHLNEQLESLEA